jgi:hypothetical protein
VKTCKACGASKPLSDYYANPAGRQGTRPECKNCTRASRKQWYEKNREREIQRVLAWQREHPEMLRERMDAFRVAGKKKISDRRSHLKRKYGLTLEDFDAMLESQGGGCAICGRPDADNVDHDHETGRVRGILCWNCNVAIGQFEDDADRVVMAAAYLAQNDELADVVRSRVVALSC